MYKQKICLGTFGGVDYSEEEQVLLFKKAGFDGFFTGYESDEQISTLATIARENDMIYQSIHAPFLLSAELWKEGEKGEKYVDDIIKCINIASKENIPLVVAHVYIGFYTGEKPTQLGIQRLQKAVNIAKEKNVKIAFENAEGEEFLAFVMDAFNGEETVGFCWDSGHEQCYNAYKDMLALYGDRLLGTHLNDNLGISRSDGKIFWTDDLHLLPFDGIIDWTDAVNRLNRVGYNGVLTFELTVHSKPDRHENDKYKDMGFIKYLAAVYARDCRISHLKNK
jgi:sugar phosphate isomerase/epimerase